MSGFNVIRRSSGDRSVGCVTWPDEKAPTPYILRRKISQFTVEDSTGKKKTRLSLCQRKVYRNRYVNIFYSKILTWSFNFVGEFNRKSDDFAVVATGTAKFKITWFGFQSGSHLDTEEVRCRYGIRRVVTNGFNASL